MCVLHIQQSINYYLKLTPSNIKYPEKSKKWVKIRSIVEGYFTDLFKVIYTLFENYSIVFMVIFLIILHFLLAVGWSRIREYSQRTFKAFTFMLYYGSLF